MMTERERYFYHFEDLIDFKSFTDFFLAFPGCAAETDIDPALQSEKITDLLVVFFKKIFLEEWSLSILLKSFNEVFHLDLTENQFNEIHDALLKMISVSREKIKDLDRMVVSFKDKSHHAQLILVLPVIHRFHRDQILGQWGDFFAGKINDDFYLIADESVSMGASFNIEAPLLVVPWLIHENLSDHLLPIFSNLAQGNLISFSKDLHQCLKPGDAEKQQWFYQNPGSNFQYCFQASDAPHLPLAQASKFSVIVNLHDLYPQNYDRGFKVLFDLIQAKGFDIQRKLSFISGLGEYILKQLKRLHAHQITEAAFDVLLMDKIFEMTAVRISVAELNLAWDSIGPDFEWFIAKLAPMVHGARQNGFNLIFFNQLNLKTSYVFIEHLKRHDLFFKLQADKLINLMGYNVFSFNLNPMADLDNRKEFERFTQVSSVCFNFNRFFTHTIHGHKMVYVTAHESKEKKDGLIRRLLMEGVDTIYTNINPNSLSALNETVEAHLAAKPKPYQVKYGQIR